jgi:hypothetical protein
VIVQWARGKSYAGLITEEESSNGKHQITYDDGSKKWYQMRKKIYWIEGEHVFGALPPPTSAIALAASGSGALAIAATAALESCGILLDSSTKSLKVELSPAAAAAFSGEGCDSCAAWPCAGVVCRTATAGPKRSKVPGLNDDEFKLPPTDVTVVLRAVGSGVAAVGVGLWQDRDASGSGDKDSGRYDWSICLGSDGSMNKRWGGNDNQFYPEENHHAEWRAGDVLRVQMSGAGRSSDNNQPISPQSPMLECWRNGDSLGRIEFESNLQNGNGGGQGMGELVVLAGGSDGAVWATAAGGKGATDASFAANTTLDTNASVDISATATNASATASAAELSTSNIVDSEGAEVFAAEKARKRVRTDPKGVVDCRIKVQWARNKVYSGVIAKFEESNGKHLVRYDDGSSKYYTMRKKTFWFENQADEESSTSTFLPTSVPSPLSPQHPTKPYAKQQQHPFANASAAADAAMAEAQNNNTASPAAPKALPVQHGQLSGFLDGMSGSGAPELRGGGGSGGSGGGGGGGGSGPLGLAGLEDQIEDAATAGYSPAKEGGEVINMKLDLDYPANAEAEEQFKHHFLNDVAGALGLTDTRVLSVQNMRAGSIILDVHISGGNSGALRGQLEAQVKDRSSALYQGKVTRHAVAPGLSLNTELEVGASGVSGANTPEWMKNSLEKSLSSSDADQVMTPQNPPPYPRNHHLTQSLSQIQEGALVEMFDAEVVEAEKKKADQAEWEREQEERLTEQKEVEAAAKAAAIKREEEAEKLAESGFDDSDEDEFDETAAKAAITTHDDDGNFDAAGADTDEDDSFEDAEGVADGGGGGGGENAGGGGGGLSPGLAERIKEAKEAEPTSSKNVENVVSDLMSSDDEDGEGTQGEDRGDEDGEDDKHTPGTVQEGVYKQPLGLGMGGGDDDDSDDNDTDAGSRVTFGSPGESRPGHSRSGAGSPAATTTSSVAAAARTPQSQSNTVAVTPYKSGAVLQHRSRRRKKRLLLKKKMVWKEVFLELTPTELKMYKTEKRKKRHYQINLTTTPLQVQEQPAPDGGGAHGFVVRWGDSDNERLELRCNDAAETGEWIRTVSANSRLASGNGGANSMTPAERAVNAMS